MAVPGANNIWDGQKQWRGGVDSSVAPTELLPGQIAWATNTTTRETFPQPRPGFNKVATLTGAGLWQGAGTYLNQTGQASLAYSVAGRVYTVGVDVWTTTELTAQVGVNNATQPHAYFCQAEDWLLIGDNLSLPIFWNQSTLRRSNGYLGSQNPSNEIPPGGPMAYGKGRVWIASGNSYKGGDLVGSNLDLADPRDSVLQMTENDYLATGGSFSVPGPGTISGLAFASNIDTSLGQGDLLVFTPDGIWAFDAPEDASTWKSLNYPVQRFALLNYGTYSQNSITKVNGDVYFRAQDGVRSYYYARREFSQAWGQTPISREVNRVLAYDTPQYLPWASSVTFDNRFLMTCAPVPDPTFGVYWNGLVALDFNWTGGIGQQFPPSWEGLWTGLKFLQVVTCRHKGVNRCFAFVANVSQQKIEVWEITTSQQFDFDGTTTTPIAWTIETPSFTFQGPNSAPLDLKKLLNADLWLDKTTGSVSIYAQYRPSLLPLWFPWQQQSICAFTQDCTTATCHSIQPYQTLAFDRIGMGQPQVDTNPSQNTLANWGYDFQVRLTINGFFRLKALRLMAQQIPEAQYGTLANTVCVPTSGETCNPGGCPSVISCNPNDFTYQSSTSN